MPAKAGGNRRERLGNLIREVIASSLLFEIKDPRLLGVSVTDVELSGDLSHAKVYVFSHDAQTESQRTNLLKALDRAAGFLRRKVGQEIRARVTPALQFRYDNSVDRGAEVEALLARVKAEDASRASQWSTRQDQHDSSLANDGSLADDGTDHA